MDATGEGVSIGSNAAGSITKDVAMAAKAIHGKGHDIWGSSDSFFFYEQKITHNSYLADRFEVEVYSKDGFGGQEAYRWAKFGLMVRDNLNPSSRHFSAFLTPSMGVHVNYRASEGGSTLSIPGDDAVRGGGWLKIERSGSRFRAYYKSDPQNDDEETFYTVLGEGTVDMSNDVHVGIAISSHHEPDECDSVEFESFMVKASNSGTLPLKFVHTSLSLTAISFIIPKRNHFQCGAILLERVQMDQCQMLQECWMVVKLLSQVRAAA